MRGEESVRILSAWRGMCAYTTCMERSVRPEHKGERDGDDDHTVGPTSKVVWRVRIPKYSDAVSSTLCHRRSIVQSLCSRCVDSDSS